MFDSEFLEIEIIWSDEDLLEITTRASNGRYSRIVQTYTQDTYLQKFADNLIGFPKKIADEVLFESDYGMDDSFLTLFFHCNDGVGHTSVKISMKEESSNPNREDNKASFELDCNLQQIEFLSRQISKMAKNRKGIAKLIK